MATTVLETPSIPTLTREEQRRLLGKTAVRHVAPHARFSLGLLSGFSARQVNALDVPHVTANGIEPMPAIVVPAVDGRRDPADPPRREPISEATRDALTRYLAERRARCAHYVRRFRTVADTQGIVRCQNCGEIADFLSAPLFDSRESDRMSLDRVRHEFAYFRRMLGLNPALRFDSLRETYLASLREGHHPDKGRR